MARCKHGSVTVNEKAEYFVCADFDGPNGNGIWYDSDPKPTGTGFVECRDCGKRVTYSQSERGRSRLPAWVITAIRIFED